MKYILKSWSGRKGGKPESGIARGQGRVHPEDIRLALPTDAFAGISGEGRAAGRAAAAGGGRDCTGSGAQGLPQKPLRPTLLCLCPPFQLPSPVPSAASPSFAAAGKDREFSPRSQRTGSSQPAQSRSTRIKLPIQGRGSAWLHRTAFVSII